VADRALQLGRLERRAEQDARSSGTVRPWRAASASIHSEAMYEYGDEKSK
jgi:hypothetical protein